MKNFELDYLPGDEVWVKGQNRISIIDQVILGKTDKGEIDVIYTWCNYDYGPDLTEVWDDGEFTPEDIGVNVFDTYEEYQEKCPECVYYWEEYIKDAGDEFNVK